MIKFYNYNIVFQEIPNMISLALNITNCQNNCVGCHSPYLQEDIGEELTDYRLNELIEDNYGIDCVILMGEGRDYTRIAEIGRFIKSRGLYAALYSGRDLVCYTYHDIFDYIKVGHYIESCGGLRSKETNQKLLQKVNGTFLDITYILNKDKVGGAMHKCLCCEKSVERPEETVSKGCGSDSCFETLYAPGPQEEAELEYDKIEIFA